MTEWHLDRKVPITLIFALVIQTGALIWWGATLESRVQSLESAIASHVITPGHSDVREDLAAIKARQELVLSRQGMIISTLDQISRNYE